MLEIEHLYGGYGDMTILSDTNLLCPAGEITTIVGRNGAGKTTLMRAIMGLIKTRHGKVLFNEQNITDWPVHRRAKAGIGYVPQGREIFPRLSLIDNLKIAAGKRTDLVLEMLATFPALERRKYSLGWNLSGGEQQILALARALVTQPKLLLVDEPTEGIQPTVVDHIADELLRIKEEYQVTVLLTEQNLDFAVRVSDRAAIIERGKIVRSIKPDDLIRDKDLIAEYMGV